MTETICKCNYRFYANIVFFLIFLKALFKTQFSMNQLLTLGPDWSANYIYIKLTLTLCLSCINVL